MYQLNNEKCFFDTSEGQAIVINFTNGMYYGTSLLGSAILERLLQGHQPEAILDAVKKLEGCPEDFSATLEGFISQLLEKEILVPGPQNADGLEPLDAAIAKEGFSLTLDEFSEVQDLILADPIHDVDVDEGWPIMKE